MKTKLFASLALFLKLNTRGRLPNSFGEENLAKIIHQLYLQDLNLSQQIAADKNLLWQSHFLQEKNWEIPVVAIYLCSKIAEAPLSFKLKLSQAMPEMSREELYYTIDAKGWESHETLDNYNLCLTIGDHSEDIVLAELADLFCLPSKELLQYLQDNRSKLAANEIAAPLLRHILTTKDPSFFNALLTFFAETEKDRQLFNELLASPINGRSMLELLIYNLPPDALVKLEKKIPLSVELVKQQHLLPSLYNLPSPCNLLDLITAAVDANKVIAVFLKNMETLTASEEALALFSSKEFWQPFFLKYNSKECSALLIACPNLFDKALLATQKTYSQLALNALLYFDEEDFEEDFNNDIELIKKLITKIGQQDYEELLTLTNYRGTKLMASLNALPISAAISLFQYLIEQIPLDLICQQLDFKIGLAKRNSSHLMLASLPKKTLKKLLAFVDEPQAFTAALEEKDRQGNTPLHLAAVYNKDFEKIISWLTHYFSRKKWQEIMRWQNNNDDAVQDLYQDQQTYKQRQLNLSNTSRSSITYAHDLDFRFSEEEQDSSSYSFDNSSSSAEINHSTSEEELDSSDNSLSSDSSYRGLYFSFSAAKSKNRASPLAKQQKANQASYVDDASFFRELAFFDNPTPPKDSEALHKLKTKPSF